MLYRVPNVTTYRKHEVHSIWQKTKQILQLIAQVPNNKRVLMSDCLARSLLLSQNLMAPSSSIFPADRDPSPEVRASGHRTAHQLHSPRARVPHSNATPNPAAAFSSPLLETPVGVDVNVILTPPCILVCVRKSPMKYTG